MRRPPYSQENTGTNDQETGWDPEPEEEKNLLHLPGTEPRYVGYAARSQVSIRTKLQFLRVMK